METQIVESFVSEQQFAQSRSWKNNAKCSSVAHEFVFTEQIFILVQKTEAIFGTAKFAHQ